MKRICLLRLAFASEKSNARLVRRRPQASVGPQKVPTSVPEDMVMTDVALSQEMALIDDPHAPDIFPDGLSGYFFLNGNIRLTFESARVSHVSVPGVQSIASSSLDW
jgi:hypothetical protein